MMALTKKDLKFIDHYMAHGNGTRAMRESGFKGKRPDQAAYDYLRKPEIKQEIERRTVLLVGQPEVVRRITERARATIADVIRIRKELTTAKPPNDEQADESAAPAEPAARTVWTLDLMKAQETGGIHQIKKLKEGKYGIEIELYDPLPALEVLARYLKLFGDDGGILKYLDLSRLTPEQLERLANGDDPLAILLNTPATAGTRGA